MRRARHRLPLRAFAAALLALPACDGHEGSGETTGQAAPANAGAAAEATRAVTPRPGTEIRVTDAWLRLPAVPGRPAAAYLTVHGGATADRLLAIESPAAERIELHEMAMAGGGMTMRTIEALPVPVGGRVTLSPGGLHAMVFGLDGVEAGKTVALTLRMERQAAITVQATVRAAGEAPHP